ncbi:MAG: cytochrome C [Burkholderiaceae bacterium]
MMMLKGNNVSPKPILAMLFIFLGNVAYADSQPLTAASRGELLYSTHCIACHSTQVHWRDKKLVTDQDSLQAEVRRWQKISRLGWDDNDIEEVAQYLNARYYHYPASD